LIVTEEDRIGGEEAEEEAHREVPDLALRVLASTAMVEIKTTIRTATNMGLLNVFPSWSHPTLCEMFG
jgi:hypothetical protein